MRTLLLISWQRMKYSAVLTGSYEALMMPWCGSQMQGLCRCISTRWSLTEESGMEWRDKELGGLACEERREREESAKGVDAMTTKEGSLCDQRG